MSQPASYNLENNINENNNLLRTGNKNVQINQSIAKKYKYASKHLENLTDDWKSKGQTDKYKTSTHLSVQKKIKALTNLLTKLGQKKINTKNNLDFLIEKENGYRTCIKGTNDLQELINKHYIPIKDIELKLNNNEFTITSLLEGPTESNTNVMKGYKKELTRLVNLYETQKENILKQNDDMQKEFTNSIKNYLEEIIQLKAKKLNEVETKLKDMLENSDNILGKLQKKLVELINSISNENIINNNLKKSNTPKPQIRLSNKSNVQVTNQDLIHKLYENYQQIKTNTNLVKKEQAFIQKINSSLLYKKKTNNPEKYEKQIVNLVVNNYFGDQELNAYKTALSKYKVNEAKYINNKTGNINNSITKSWDYYSTLLKFRIEKAQAIFEEVIKMCKKLSVLIDKLEKSKVYINKVPATTLNTTRQYLQNIKTKYEEMAKLTMNNCLNMNKKLQGLNISSYLSAINEQLKNNGSQRTGPIIIEGNLTVEGKVQVNTSNNEKETYPSNTNSNRSFQTLENTGTYPPNSNEEINIQSQEIMMPPNNKDKPSVKTSNNSKKISNGNIKPENLYEFIFEHLFTSNERKKLLSNNRGKVANSLLKKEGRNTKSLLNKDGELVKVNNTDAEKRKTLMEDKVNVLKNIITQLESYDESKMKEHLKKYPTKRSIFTSSTPQPENKNGYTKNLKEAGKIKTSMEDKVRFAFDNRDKLIEHLKDALKKIK